MNIQQFHELAVGDRFYRVKVDGSLLTPDPFVKVEQFNAINAKSLGRDGACVQFVPGAYVIKEQS